jgi:hypothetical protein
MEPLPTNQGRIGPWSKSSASGEAKPNMEKNAEEVAVEQNRVLEVNVETRTEVGTSS